MQQSIFLFFDLAPGTGLERRLKDLLARRFRLIGIEVGTDGALPEEAELDELVGPEQPGRTVALVGSPSCTLPGLGLLIDALHRRWPRIPVVLATSPGKGDAEKVIELLQAGVADLAVLPLCADDLLPRLWRLGLGSPRVEEAAAEDEVSAASRALAEEIGLRRLVGESTAFRDAVRRMPLMARCDATVLIAGETGTGKGVCARAIHHLSRRSGKPFVAVDCGALPVELVENELFGHRRSAYTSAATDYEGLVASAEGGTLLLDEIDSLPASAQVKLLRFLQEKEYRPLGASRPIRADVRLIAATNAELERLVEQGRFRRDLYYRLHVLPLRLPPLSERREDIPLLARHFLARHAGEHDAPCPRLSPAAIGRLLGHSWPGNVRELEHVMERTVLLGGGRREVRPEELDLGTSGPRRTPTFKEAKQRVVTGFERGYVEDLLLVHGGNISRAARAAGKNRRAFWELIRKHDVNAGRFRTSG